MSDGETSRGSRLARFRFVNGQTLTTTSSALTKYTLISGANNTTCAIDPSTNRLIMRYRGGSTFRYAVYSLAAVKAGTPAKLHDVAQPSQVQRARSVAGKSLDYREPEGMAIQIVSGAPRLCLGLASGVEKARLASIFYKSELV
ncbi:hypothetical protein [Nonomuraea sp. NPDC049709]|uniref:hypothetical protein n=1 Tax=Nonomuraea sp. NPDC049709 TaxID=3154736 RepID=UPI00341D303E